MNNKTNLLICILIALSINLQCSILVYASDEADPTITTNIDSVEIIQDETASNTGIEEGTELTLETFAPDDQEQ